MIHHAPAVAEACLLRLAILQLLILHRLLHRLRLTPAPAPARDATGSPWRGSVGLGGVRLRCTAFCFSWKIWTFNLVISCRFCSAATTWRTGGAYS